MKDSRIAQLVSDVAREVLPHLTDFVIKTDPTDHTVMLISRKIKIQLSILNALRQTELDPGLTLDVFSYKHFGPPPQGFVDARSKQFSYPIDFKSVTDYILCLSL